VSERIYEHLLTQPEHTAAAIARSTKQPSTSVRKALKRLLSHGLVSLSRAEGLYIGEPKTIHELERIAAALDLRVIGTGARVKRRHELEREKLANKDLYNARRYWRQFTQSEV